MQWLTLMLLAPGIVLVAGAFAPLPALRTMSRNFLVSYTVLALALVGGELYFRFVHAQSENILTRSTGNWLDRYWQTNSLGFRDREWTPEDWEGRETVLLLGDSFAAGWGIDDPADRFGNVLADLLGDDYAVINAAEYGRSTPEQLEIAREHPLQDPDVIILQYFLNDISYAQLRLGLQLDPGETPWWANESYLLNFLYYRFLINILQSDETDWQEYDFAAYDNPTIWQLHRSEIEAFIDYADEIEARLIVVIFPNMLYPFRSIPYVDRVAQVFEARGKTEVLKLFEEANAWPLEERIVSPRDTHPSVAFHRMVGERLYTDYFADDAG
jgi:hypothetical protein